MLMDGWAYTAAASITAIPAISRHFRITAFVLLLDRVSFYSRGAVGSGSGQASVRYIQAVDPDQVPALPVVKR